jgi:hypothetical protein
MEFIILNVFKDNILNYFIDSLYSTMGGLISKIKKLYADLSVYFIVMQRASGKTLICERLNSDCVVVDVDAIIQANLTTEQRLTYESLQRGLNTNTCAIMLLPIIRRIVVEMRANYKNKKLVFVSSLFELKDYLEILDCRYSVLLPSARLHEQITQGKTEAERQAVVKSRETIMMLSDNKKLKVYDNYDELLDIVINMTGAKKKV